MRLALCFCLVCTWSLAQDADSLFNRLQAFRHGDNDFYNVDGIDITFIPMQGEFEPKVIAKNYKPLKVKASELEQFDKVLRRSNYVVSKTYKSETGSTAYIDHYFLEDTPTSMVSMSFQAHFKPDAAFARRVIELAMARKIPDSLFQPPLADGFNFAGRHIPRQMDCRWTEPNSLQCPYNGQMNWSSYKTLDAAQAGLEYHFNHINAGKKGTVISDEQVDVVFEEQDAKARKIVFDLTGVTSALAAVSGGKTLTIYMVVARVRGKYVTCVMSHWNNDRLNENGLPALAGEVIRLK